MYCNTPHCTWHTKAPCVPRFSVTSKHQIIPCPFSVCPVYDAKLSGFTSHPEEESSGPYIPVNLRPQIRKDVITPYQTAPGKDEDNDSMLFMHSGVVLMGCP